MSSHYSQAFTPNFSTKCRYAAKELARQFEGLGKGYPVLCYTGFSGVTAATMLAMYLSELGLRVEQIYVRKPGEKSHGSHVEFSNRNLGQHAVPVFVDDFVDTGGTHNMVKNALIEFHEYTFEVPHLQRTYEDWYAFYCLSELEDIDFWDGDNPWQLIPHVLIGDDTSVDLRPELWENDLPYLTEDAA